LQAAPSQSSGSSARPGLRRQAGAAGLSLRMIKRLHEGLKIPYESLLAGVS
jgi:hypothetical protein